MNNVIKGNTKVLFFSTLAFFITFVVWFNMAPFNTTLVKAFDMTKTKELAVLLIANLALTIPARESLSECSSTNTDQRKNLLSLLVISSIPCFAFAVAHFLLAITG